MRRYLRISLFASACCLLFGGCSRKEPVKSYQMGERAELGRLIYSVFETQWLTQVGVSPEARVPQNRFFVVRVSVMNSGSSPADVPSMKVVDDNGNVYDEANGDGIPQWLGFLRSVKPAEAAQGNVVFDVPPRHYKLIVTDEYEQKTATVDLPLTFNADTPDLPLPTTEKK